MPFDFKPRLFNQEHIFTTIEESFKNLPHIFLTGPAGCGKTTLLEDIIRFLQHAPFQVESVLWLSSEKDRGIHTIRDKVNDFCKRSLSRPNSLRFIIIDDADSLPLISQQALRRPMETYSHLTRFLFASRTPSSMIEPLRSRCFHIEIEPVGCMDAYPLFVKSLGISSTPELQDFCLRNFVSLHELTCILKLYKSLVKDGKTSSNSIKELASLLPSSSLYTQDLVRAIGKKEYTKVREGITNLFLSGYVLDDIILSIERNIAIFPSIDPEFRYSILQFAMLGWISIQQGKEHWLDVMDIIEQVERN